MAYNDICKICGLWLMDCGDCAEKQRQKDRLKELENKLAICVEALKKYQDYAIKEGYADPVFVAKEALKKVGEK